MSYQVSVRIATGSEHPTILCDIGNYTDNVEEMWDTALSPTTLRALHNTICSTAEPLLTTAINNMRANPATYRTLRGSGSLGDFEGALDYLVRLRQCCLEHPLAFVHITRRLT
jgi:hypothetical protein